MRINKRIKLLGLGLVLSLSLGFSISQAQPIDAVKAPIVKKDKKKRVISRVYYYNNNQTKQAKRYKYQGNTKRLKQQTIINYNGKKINSKTIGKVYNYNKKGQLKSNKYGKATRADYKYFLNNKVAAKRICTYNVKGKLKCGKWNTKSYKKNKAVPVYKTTPAKYQIIKGKPTVYDYKQINAFNDGIVFIISLDLGIMSTEYTINHPSGEGRVATGKNIDTGKKMVCKYNLIPYKKLILDGDCTSDFSVIGRYSADTGQGWSVYDGRFTEKVGTPDTKKLIKAASKTLVGYK